jgi:NuA3 HAT complex component NTO1
MAPATKQKLRSILEAITAADTYKTFQRPVKKASAPDYYDIIKEPMHLKTVRAKLERGDYDDEFKFKRVRPH